MMAMDTTTNVRQKTGQLPMMVLWTVNLGTVFSHTYLNYRIWIISVEKHFIKS